MRIEDVAAHAAVSIKTVSRVLNNEPNVRQSTREHVLRSVESLQYKPNLSARSLAGQRSYVIALAYNNPSRNYLMEIQGGTLEACRANHYNLILAPIGVGARRGTDIRAVFEYFKPDGVLLIPPLTDDKVVLSFLRDQGIPFACVAPKKPEDHIGVWMEDTAAAVELITALIVMGHRRIGHIKGPTAHGASGWRHAGYRQALERAGLAYRPELVSQGDFSFDSGVKASKSLLDLDEPPTAIFAANDDMAAGVIREARVRGISIPKNLSVCGFDDTPIARHIYPALTTVRQPTAEMGHRATIELLQRIKSLQLGRMARVEHDVVFRESTCPPSAEPAKKPK